MSSAEPTILPIYRPLAHRTKFNNIIQWIIFISCLYRTKLNGYSSVFSAAGSLSVFLSYVVWDRDAMQAFQFFCFMLAIFSALGFFFVSRYLSRQYRHLHKKDDSMVSIVR